MSDDVLRAPFPYFGGKAQVAAEVWQRFGDVPNYVEPFAGSLAVLLSRPHEPKIETVNDADGLLANFWRALQAEPGSVAQWADWPVNEVDLLARHLWLVERKHDLTARLEADPEWYDAKAAGWWVWGICSWIGSGWCSGNGPWMHDLAGHVVKGDAGRGVNRQLPHLGDAGRGVNRKLPHLGDAGRGVNRQLPHLGNAGMGVNRATNGALLAYFAQLAARLRRVRVCCGDWSRVCGPSPTVQNGTTAVFLDPPYSVEAGRDGELYAVEDLSVAHAVREWALSWGGDPRMRIALCGYDSEHGEHMPDGWTAVPWKAHGGYGSQGNGSGRTNAAREVVWFSPHCLKPNRVRHAAVQAPLFTLELAP